MRWRDVIARGWICGWVVVLACRDIAEGAEPATNWPAVTRDDRIVFFGDSITAHGQRPYGYVTLFGLQFEDYSRGHDGEVIGAGVGWHRIPDLRDRLERDVLARKPTIVVIQCGINDLCQSDGDTEMGQKLFIMGMKDLIWRIRRARARPVLATLTVAGEKTDGTNQYDTLIEKYSELIRELGREKKCQVIELRARFMAHLEKVNPDNLPNNVLTVRDGAHLNPRGNQFLCNLILEAMRLDTVDEWWDTNVVRAVTAPHAQPGNTP